MGAMKPLWRPCAESVRHSNLGRFIRQVADTCPQVSDYNSLYRWSIEHSDQFWSSLWDFSGVVSSRRWDRVLVNPTAMPGAVWFEGARLNFAENLLRFRDDHPALIFRNEIGTGRELSYRQLFREVVRCAQLLKALGVGPRDRVAGYMTNSPETIIAMLATASLGAIWSSCSPDFGANGALERFARIQPKVLFCVDGYHYNGKRYDVMDAVKSVATGIPCLQKVIVVPYLHSNPDISGLDNAMFFADFESASTDLEFVQSPFDHPLYILYSSGTTGQPKCIAHGAGGTLLQHLKEHSLHTDVKRPDRLFYYTTCGWMMWNWMASGLASGCTLVLYDGAPLYPAPDALWKMADALKISIFGVSARYISACAKSGLAPARENDLGDLRAILSTGSPLAPESFDYVYRDVKSDVMLASISGGTDIVSCFVLGNPMRPVYRGEIQGAGLGMAVDVYGGEYDDATALRGQCAELVCTRPFPSMPLGLWNEPDGRRYHESYFSRFRGVWAQGDYAEMTANDGFIIYGRCDATLNPGGVRIGTAEIYRQVEKIDEALESLCIAQKWDGDVRVVLFVMLRDGLVLTDELKDSIRRTIRENTTPRHVPKKIVAVADIPRTRSGKLAELAVRNVVHGEDVKNTEALANPEALEYFRNIEELQTQ